MAKRLNYGCISKELVKSERFKVSCISYPEFSSNRFIHLPSIFTWIFSTRTENLPFVLDGYRASVKVLVSYSDCLECLAHAISRMISIFLEKKINIIMQQI